MRCTWFTTVYSSIYDLLHKRAVTCIRVSCLSETFKHFLEIIVIRSEADAIDCNFLSCPLPKKRAEQRYYYCIYRVAGGCGLLTRIFKKKGGGKVWRGPQSNK
jgi:hypothetical protein